MPVVPPLGRLRVLDQLGPYYSKTLSQEEEGEKNKSMLCKSLLHQGGREFANQTDDYNLIDIVNRMIVFKLLF